MTSYDDSITSAIPSLSTARRGLADKKTEASVRLVPLPPPSTKSSHPAGSSHNPSNHRYTDSWIPELSAVALSSICLVVIAIILGRYNGKPVPRLRTGLTLNAIISILATTSKASLIFAVSNSVGQLKWVWFNGSRTRTLLDAEIFDDASRGPLGAIQMLFASARRSAASLGAILIILALAFDPFVQQATRYDFDVQYEPTDQSSVQPATIPAVVAVNAPNQGFNWTSALNSVFWRDDFEWDMVTCPNGNCTWSDYATLAWHSKCYRDPNWALSTDCNLKYNVTDGRNIHPLVKDCSVTHQTPDTVPTEHNSNSVVNMSLTIIWSGYERASVRFLLNSSLATTKLDDIGSRINQGESIDPVAPMLKISELKLVKDRDISLEATTCELDLYLDRFDILINQGKMETTMHESTILEKSLLTVTPDYSNSSQQFYLCLTPSPLSSIGNFFPASLRAHSYDETYVFLRNTSQCVSSLSGNPTTLTWWPDAIAEKLYMRGNMSYEYGECRECYLGDGGYDLGQADLTGSENPVGKFVSDSVNADAWTEKGIERVMSNVAASLNKYMLGPDNVLRTSNGTQLVYGEVGVSKTIVRVNWLWLILLYSLCTLGIIFLLWTIVLSHRSGAPLWKSSINALLYHGIDSDPDAWVPLATIPEMDAQAAKTQARLGPVGIHERLMLETTDMEGE